MLLLQPTNLAPHAAAARDSKTYLDLLHRSSHPARCLLHGDDVREPRYIAVDALGSPPVNSQPAQMICDKTRV